MGQAADWIRPTMEERGIRQYVSALWRGRWIILATVATGVLGAVFYLTQTNNVYEASADMLVSPIPNTDTTFEGLSVLRTTGDQTRNVETVVRLVATPAVARRAAADLGLDRSAGNLLSDIKATPVAQSDIVTITARADTADLASRLADGFARAAIEERTQRLHRQIDDLVAQLRPLTDPRVADPATRAETSARLARLESLRSRPDPTLRLEVPAERPTSPASPLWPASIVVGLLGGLIVGVGAAFAVQLIDPRVQRANQLRERFALPILARVPRARRSWFASRGRLGMEGVDSLRALRTYVVDRGNHSRAGRLVVVLGATEEVGKTTTAVNLARALAMSNKRVLLVDADVQRPKVARELDVEPEIGLLGVLLEDVSLESALATVADEPAGLRLLLPENSDPSLTNALTDGAVERLVIQSRVLFDWMVVDTPPLDQAAGMLPFASLGGQVILVVHLGSRVSEVHRLTDMLHDNGVRPAGFVLVGTKGGRAY